jgi:D-3-phosphoglycerate dehydrogenase
VTTQKWKILVCDPLDEAGAEIFKNEPNIELVNAPKPGAPEIKTLIKDVVGVVVRSGTTLTADWIKEGDNLRIIGRAGVGVDNVDVAAASRRGIVVANTPGGNTISAAEQTLALMLCLARNIAPAHQTMCEGRWDRKKFTGIELFEKTLGLVGMGRIGTEVARRAASFGMRVLAYDPFLRPERARDLGVESVTLDEIYRQSDFISLHVPMTDETRNMINAQALAKMKKGVRIINCARGGLIDETAALAALKSGQAAGFALDVFEKEPPAKSEFLDHPNVLKTPHLGASTEEAQIKVSIDIAKTMVDYLKGKGIRNAVNIPAVDPETLKNMEPYLLLARRIGSILSQVAEGQTVSADIRLSGKVAEFPTAPISSSMLEGLLSPILEGVNIINAPYLAEERGIKVTVTQSKDSQNYASLVTLELVTTKERHTLSGTLDVKSRPRVVMIDEMRLECVADGRLLFIENQDVPGMVGLVGTVLGQNRVNIADMSVGRDPIKKKARIFISVDADVNETVLKSLRSDANILSARFIRL